MIQTLRGLGISAVTVVAAGTAIGFAYLALNGHSFGEVVFYTAATLFYAFLTTAGAFAVGGKDTI